MLRHRTVEAIITDIEGTTTSLSFVKDTLFPYARERLASYVKEHANEEQVQNCLAQVYETLTAEQEIAAPTVDNAIEAMLQWIDQDRKHTALKSLQGMIWRAGYEQGDFKGHVYDDVLPFLIHVKGKDLPVYIFSSGSVEAQKLLFAHTEFGDLTKYIADYFDTTTGPKKAPKAYRDIVRKIGVIPEHSLFVSDNAEELNAAGEAGLQTMQLLRPGVDVAVGHHNAHDFTAFWPELRAHL